MGRVIPTKVTFKLDDGTVVTDAVAAAHGWTIEIGVNGPIPATGGPTDLVEAFADAGPSNAGSNVFRWSSGQWIYNLDTGKPQVQMEVNKSYRSTCTCTTARTRSRSAPPPTPYSSPPSKHRPERLYPEGGSYDLPLGLSGVGGRRGGGASG